MQKILLAALLAACTSEPEQQTAGQHVLEMCGPPPAFPGLAAAFARQPDGRLMAVITTQTYGELVAYRLDALAWQDCVGGLP
jgi:hypothetical protein